MRRGSIVFVAMAAVVAAAPAPEARPSDRAPASPALEIPALPDGVDSLLAQERRKGSNAMFAFFGNREHKGYTWSAYAYKASPSARTLLTIGFGRTIAEDTQHQTSIFTWILPKGALRMDRDLRPASLTTRRSLGSNGSIAMRLANRGRYLRVQGGEGCTSGSISVRTGRFAGRFRVHLRDEYFQRLAFRRTPVVMWREHDLKCRAGEPPPPPCPRHFSFNAVEEEGGVVVGAFRTPEGRVDQIVVVARKSGRADALHTISVTLAVPESFEASDDLTTASIDGDAGAPWLGGDLSYVAPPASEGEDERCGPYRESSGVATGDYTAYFDSVGPVTPAATGVPATLRLES